MNAHRLRNVPSKKNAKLVLILDPIHNFIDISEYAVIQELIDTPYFQRLRRLYQLSLVHMVYPNATHTRFAHSVGVMHVFLTLFDGVVKNSKLKKARIKKLRPVGAVAALLHDIGHGPFSHLSERFLDGGSFNHEKLTRRIILETEISDILKRNNIDPQLICDILSHEVSGDLLFVSQLISSQLDADRLDYLMRDALFTGVPYGKIDLHRIASTLKIWNKNNPKKTLKGTVVVLEKGKEAIENYLLGRYHMYTGVYHHKAGRCMENILVKLFERALELSSGRKNLGDLAKTMTPTRMLGLDDHVLYNIIHKWNNSSDKILKCLSKSLIDRTLFEIHEIDDIQPLDFKFDKVTELEKEFKKKGLNPTYYFICQTETKSGYEPYRATSSDDVHTAISHIMIMKKNNLEEISVASPLIDAISKNNYKSDRIFYPKKLSPAVDKILEISKNRRRRRSS